MSVKIRLKRIGRKKQPSYRVVVTESRNSRSGEIIECVGNYCPYVKGKTLNLNLERIAEWRNKGAIPSESVLRLIKIAKRSGTCPESERKNKPEAITSDTSVSSEVETTSVADIAAQTDI